jgi:hypothetical protein
MRANKFISVILILSVYVSCYSCKFYGYVVTTNGKYFYGKITLPDDAYNSDYSPVNSKRNNTLKIKTKNKSGKKTYRITISDIKYAKAKWWVNKDSTVFKPLKRPYGISLCQLVVSKGNAGIFSFTKTTYYNTPSPYGSTSSSGMGYILLSNDIATDIWYTPPVQYPTGMTKKRRRANITILTLKPMLLGFINNRYNQHFTKKDFKSKGAMFNYILDKENEREENNNKTAN